MPLYIFYMKKNLIYESGQIIIKIMMAKENPEGENVLGDTFPESLAISGFGTACVEANRATKTT